MQVKYKSKSKTMPDIHSPGKGQGGQDLSHSALHHVA